MPDVLGLPAHPLLVHLVVVLVPLAATSHLLLFWRVEWWQRFAPAIVLLGCIGALASILAVESGEALRNPVRHAAAAQGVEANLGDHPQLSELSRIVSVAFAVSLVAFFALAARAKDGAFWSRAWLGSRVASALTAGAAIAAVVLAGHTGSQLVWRDIGVYPEGVAAPLPSAPAVVETPVVSQPVEPESTFRVSMQDNVFVPAEIRVTAGKPIAFEAVNEGLANHTFTMATLRLDTGMLLPGQAKVLTTGPLAPGRYNFICVQDDHDRDGMVGVLVVEASP